MASTPACLFCPAEDSWKHALINCITARCVWSLSSEEIVEHMCDSMSLNAKNWIFTMHEKLKHEEFTRMIVTLWAIWRSRRKAIHEDICDSPMQIHLSINAFLRDIQIISMPVQWTNGSRAPRSALWQPPPLDHVKFNVDAAVSRWKIWCGWSSMQRRGWHFPGCLFFYFSTHLIMLHWKHWR